LEEGHLLELIKKFKPHYKRLMGDREPYKSVIEADGIILHVGLDASPITSRAGVTQLPVLLLIGNIPLASRIRYPLMAAMFCAKGPKPSSEVLLAEMRKELRELGETGVLWEDDGGNRHCTEVSIPVAQTDYTQKCETLQHCQAGYYGCTMCTIQGKSFQNYTKTCC
jgi:hypothetical protein